MTTEQGRTGEEAGMGQARGSFSHLRQEAEERAERHGAKGSLIDRQGAHTACQPYPGYFKSVHLAFLRPLGRCLWTALARNPGLCEQVSASRLGPEDVGQISRVGAPLSCGKVRVREDRHAPTPTPESLLQSRLLPRQPLPMCPTTF